MRKILLLSILALLMLFACTSTTKIDTETRNVFYVGGNNGVRTALLQAGYTLVDDFENTDVFVLNGDIPDVAAIAAKLQTGAGLVLVVGEGMSFRDIEVLLGYPVSALWKHDNLVSLASDEYLGNNDPLQTEINWNDAPPIRERATIFSPRPGKPLVRVNGYAGAFLMEIGNPPENKYTISAFLNEQHNLQFQEWEYFNYLIYHLVERAAGTEPLNFVDYEALTKEK